MVGFQLVICALFKKQLCKAGTTCCVFNFSGRGGRVDRASARSGKDPGSTPSAGMSFLAP